jgi:hypothetical protein
VTETVTTPATPSDWWNKQYLLRDA